MNSSSRCAAWPRALGQQNGGQLGQLERDARVDLSPVGRQQGGHKNHDDAMLTAFLRSDRTGGHSRSDAGRRRQVAAARRIRPREAGSYDDEHREVGWFTAVFRAWLQPKVPELLDRFKIDPSWPSSARCTKGDSRSPCHWHSSDPRLLSSTKRRRGS